MKSTLQDIFEFKTTGTYPFSASTIVICKKN